MIIVKVFISFASAPVFLFLQMLLLLSFCYYYQFFRIFAAYDVTIVVVVVAFSLIDSFGACFTGNFLSLIFSSYL